MTNIPKNSNISRSGRRVSHKSTWTQSNSFKQTNRERKRTTQAEVICHYLRTNGPATSRQIATKLDQERTSVTRSLKDLEDANRVEIAFVATCPTTKRPVQWYNIATDSDKQQQGSLFASSFTSKGY